MSGVIKAASTDQYAQVKLWTTADGLPKTDATFETSGLSIKWQINNGAIQSVTVAGSPAPASMSAGGAHADWGIYHRGNGWYVIGLADAVLATAGNRVSVWIELTDCDSAPAEIYVSGYDGSAVAVGANTVTPDNAGIASNGVAIGNVPNATEIRTELDDNSTKLAAIVADTNELQTNQGDWATATEVTLSTVYQNSLVAAIDAALLDAGDATDLIASIVTRIGNTNVDEASFVAAVKAALFDAGSASNKLAVNASGQVESSNMRGTDSAMLAASYTAPDNTSITAILADTNELQLNQGNWLTATGFAVAGDEMALEDGAIKSTTFAAGALDAVWTATTRTLTTIADSSGITTLLARITGTVRTATADVSAETAQTTAIRDGLATAVNVTAAAQSVIDHGDGDGAWGATSAGGAGGLLSGAFSLVFTVKTTADVAIPNAVVRVFNATGDQEIKYTNASGVASFAVEADSWDYTIRASNFVGVTGTKAVSENATVAIALTLKTIAANADAALSNVQLQIIDQHGKAVANAPIFARIENREFASSAFVTNRNTNATTDSDGYVILELIQIGEFSDSTAVYKIDVGVKGEMGSFRINAPTLASETITAFLT